VEIATYRVIYDLVDEMRARMEGRLASVEERVDVGEAQVRAVFGGGKGKVAGCLVTDGALRLDALVDVRFPLCRCTLPPLCSCLTVNVY
jgi:translation initiation factor IF-2